jgi:hypothetical protein
MLKKPASQATEADLQLLITNSVSERRNIDYKRDLPGTTDGEKKEFLADVSSFANAIGGFLIFGMTETGGLPTAITGTKAVDCDREAQRIENLLATGLQPRIRYELAWISTVQGPVLLIEIDKSFVGPHRVILGDHGHFYARNSTGKYRLDVSDLRQAFGASARLLDRIREFHADRLLRVAREDAPVPNLLTSARVVLHIVPLSAFDSDDQLDLRPLLRTPTGLPPMEHGSIGVGSFNYDGAIVSTGFSPVATYTHVFWNGTIEAVDTMLLAPWSGPDLVIPGQSFEECIVGYTFRCLSFLETFGVAYPMVLIVALVGVTGYRMALNQYSKSAPIDRDAISLPRAVINSAFDNSTTSLATLFKPAFDRLWHSCGRAGSPHFETDGTWKLTAKRYP